jgi:transcription-repair coupling factor (superfamily II helicase)
VPEPLSNLISLQQARIKLGRAGARVVSLRGEALAATPLELSPEQARALGERVPGARYEPGRSQVTFRVPHEAEGRFRIVVDAADALLAVTAPAPEAAAA